MTKDRARKRAARARVQITGEPFRTASELVATGSHGVNKLARLRAAYTGERLAEARAGIAAEPGLGLDSCDQGQAHLRALLALGMFNGSEDMPTGPLGSSNVAGLVTYTITVSPRHDHLVLITNAPGNIARRLVPTNPATTGVPGMRLERTYRHRTALLRHLPTEAALVVTSRRDLTAHTLHEQVQDSCNSEYGRMTIADKLTGWERERLAAIPALGRDATRMLAALTVRLNLADPDRRWAVGSFFWDPLSRVAEPGYDLRVSRGPRSLTGERDLWRLAWQSFPYRDDLVAALTDPVIGMADIEHHEIGAMKRRAATLLLDGPSLDATA